MKATELMIGDWVYYGDKPVQVLQLSDGKYYPHIKPIPLTPEILEKNGWFYPKQSSWMELDNPNRELWGCIHTDGTLWLYSSGDCDKDESFAEIKYVHELQHCLKLCNIQKNIEI